MWIQKGLKACASFEMLMDAIYFDNITEYDPDVVFYKNLVFAQFSFFFFFKPTYIEVLIKTMFEARIQSFLCVFESRGYLFWCIACSDIHAIKIFWPWNFSENRGF